MAPLKTRGLRKTVGVPGLFATAYGNVGSSIYYALGLVAAHALGLTPVVFLFAGGLFALTAKTYAEGAAMFPEAGSSSFARHAFNEVVSAGDHGSAPPRSPGRFSRGLLQVGAAADLRSRDRHRGDAPSRRRGRPDATVDVFYVLRIPPEHDLPDGGFDALEAARLAARSRGLKVRVNLVRCRNPGKAIVEEARERGSDLTYLSTEHAPSDERLLGPTTRYILARRPCRVIVEGAGANGAAPTETQRAGAEPVPA
jgi:nucleotide-binding universal stress UspA family protein